VAEQFSVEQEFEKAQQWKLTDEDIERARLLLGVDAPESRDLFITEASSNNMRNYAFGIGDDNPLFCDPDYGRNTRWGAQIASPSMCEAMGKTLRGDRISAWITPTKTPALPI
jgi:acyl dehydratase